MVRHSEESTDNGSSDWRLFPVATCYLWHPVDRHFGTTSRPLHCHAALSVSWKAPQRPQEWLLLGRKKRQAKMLSSRAQLLIDHDHPMAESSRALFSATFEPQRSKSSVKHTMREWSAGATSPDARKIPYSCNNSRNQTTCDATRDHWRCKCL